MAGPGPDPVSTLARVGSAVYATRQDGSFVDPSDELAALLLGPDKRACDLEGRKASDFYAIPSQRGDFTGSLISEPGRPDTRMLRLRLAGEETWCRCTSVYLAEQEVMHGLVIRLARSEEYVPENLLSDTLWAIYRTDDQGRTVWSSSLDAALVGRATDDVIGRARSATHWARDEQRIAFRDAVASSGNHRARVEFRTAKGRIIQAEVHAHALKHGGQEGIWRDVTGQFLTERIGRAQSLAALDHGIIAALTDGLGFERAAWYRYHGQDDRYLLRAARGIGGDLQLPVDFVAPSSDPVTDGEQILVRGEAPGSLLLAVSLPRAADGNGAYGFLWVQGPQDELESFQLVRPEQVEMTPADVHRQQVEAFARQLGSAARAGEERAVEAGRKDLLDEAVRFLAAPESPSGFHARFLDVARSLLGAEAGSTFLVEDLDGEPALRLKETTGLDSRPSDEVVQYRLGEQLTGSIALEPHPVSFMDVEAARKTRDLPPPRHVESVEDRPRTWLGCQVRNNEGELLGLLRLVNRRIEGLEGGEPGGFSEADRRLGAGLSQVYGYFCMLEAARREQVYRLESILHDVLGPLVSIRARAARMRSYINERDIERMLDQLQALKGLAADYGAELSRLLRRIQADRRLGEIDTDASMAAELVRDLRFIAHGQPLYRDPVHLLRDVVQPLSQGGLRGYAKSRGYGGLEILAERLRGMPWLALDRRLMAQVLQNLFTNAVKYGPPPGPDKTLRIELSFESTPSHYVVQVRDHGIGIRPEDIDHIFERGFRAAHARRTDPSGRGFGLDIARRIMHMHHGSITLANPADPTVFELRFRTQDFVKAPPGRTRPKRRRS